MDDHLEGRLLYPLIARQLPLAFGAAGRMSANEASGYSRLTPLVSEHE